MAGSLAGKIAVVTGATRHAGRGVAIELGAAGATVYCTGRSVRGKPSPLNKPETIEETAELVDAHGGEGIAVRVDHTVIDEVEALFDRVISEQGHVDLLVNNVSGDGGTGHPFLDTGIQTGLDQITTGAFSHIIATRVAARRMVDARSGLIVSISDHEWDPPYYAMQKALANRLVLATADELRPHGIAIMSVLPGAFFRCFDIMTEQALESAIERDPLVAKCHTPRLVGRAVVALASDPSVAAKSGALLEMRSLIEEYGFTDIDGRQSGEMW